MVQITKKTIYREGMTLEPLKMGKISILTSRNLIKENKKEKNNDKVKYNDLEKRRPYL